MCTGEANLIGTCETEQHLTQLVGIQPAVMVDVEAVKLSSTVSNEPRTLRKENVSNLHSFLPLIYPQRRLNGSLRERRA